MDAGVKPSVVTTNRFSFGWCFAFAFLHIVGTFVIAGLRNIANMGFSTREAEFHPFTIFFWNSLLWIWTPLASTVRSPDHLPNENLLFSLTILWSCLIGITAGFFVPFLRRRICRSSLPVNPKCS
jgi:hypothetical protein